MLKTVYLDNNATTALDPLVAEAMIQDKTFLLPANPSSAHTLGQAAKSALVKARAHIASYLRVHPHEILFTSGGTESMNLLLQGLIHPLQKTHIVSTQIEHASVDLTLRFLQKQGHLISFLPMDSTGLVTKKALDTHLEKTDTKIDLLIFSAVNGETGIIQDLEMLSSFALSHNIPLIIDGVALLGKSFIHIFPGITGMGFSAHKIHGPKGVGFCFLRKNTPLSPLFHGGGQEYGLRSGTENCSGILGLSKAIELIPETTSTISALRDLLEQTLIERFPSIQINGSSLRISNVSNLYIPFIDAETLLISLDQQGIYASQGSACSAGALEPSRVLTHMGFSSKRVKSSIRFSLSRYTTQEEILHTCDVLSHYCIKYSSL